jgi:hypothetical protein
MYYRTREGTWTCGYSHKELFAQCHLEQQQRGWRQLHQQKKFYKHLTNHTEKGCCKAKCNSQLRNFDN